MSRNPRRKGKRVYHRDARGRFAPAPGGPSDRKKKRRRAVMARSAVAVGVAATQAHPASRTRTGITKRKIVRKHVTRASADHKGNTSRRNRVFPTRAIQVRRFDAKAARREGRTLTAGFRKGVKSVRRSPNGSPERHDGDGERAMMPVAVWEAITADPDLNTLGINADTVFEAQSMNGDERPSVNGHFVVVDFQEQTLSVPVNRGPRVMDIAVHVPWDITREYDEINRILNAVDSVLLPREQVTGTDGIRVTCIRPSGRSRNLSDPGWHTTTRFATYNILYDETAA